MHVLVIWIVWVNTELETRSSEVPFFKEIATVIVVDESPNSDIKLPLVNKQRLFYILLDHE